MKTFFWFFRPLLILSKLIGVVPLGNIFASKPNDLTRSFWANLYSAIIFTTSIVGIYFLSKMGLSLDDKDLPKIYLNYIVILIILRSIICFVLSFRNVSKFPILIQLLDIFDVKRESILKSRMNTFLLKFTVRTLLPIAATIILFYFTSKETIGLFGEVYPNNTGLLIFGNTQIAPYLFGFLSIWQVIPSILYLYIAITLVLNFELINRTLIKKHYIGNYFCNHATYDQAMGHTLEEIRYFHNLLSECVCKLGNLFGNLMAVDRLVVMTMLVFNISVIINGHEKNDHLLFVTILNGIQVLAIIFVSDRVKQAGNHIIDLIHGIPLSSIDPKSQNEIRMLMIQLSVRPVAISADGYFTIDKTLLLTTMSSIATYLIVIVQIIDDNKDYQTCSNKST